MLGENTDNVKDGAMNSLVLFILLMFFCASCVEKHTPETAVADRTVIVYIAADNNLSGEVSSKISALEEGFSQVDASRNRLVIFADRAGQGASLMEVLNGGIETVAEYPEFNSADTGSMKRIISEIALRDQSKSYGFICFSHASGWLPAGALNDPQGYHKKTDAYGGSGVSQHTVLQDGDVQMEISDFADAVALPGGKKYDFIVFENCYMAGIEVAYELSNVADYMLASSTEILSPGFLYSYRMDLSLLYEKDADLVGFAESYFDYWNSRTGAWQSATVSVIDLSYIPMLAQKAGAIIRTGRYLVSDPSGIQHFNRNYHHLFFDLSQYLEAVSGGQVPELMEEYYSILGETVPYSDATESFMTGYPYSFEIKSSCGLTTYIMQPGLETLNDDYMTTKYYIDNL